MKRILLLAAAAALLGAWCHPDYGCGQPLPPAYGRPYPTERYRPPVFVPDDPRLPPTRSPSQLRDPWGRVPPGFYVEPRRHHDHYPPPPPHWRW